MKFESLQNPTFKKIVNISSVLCLAIFLLFKINSWKSSLPWDFYQLWAVGQAIEKLEITDIYSRADQKVMSDYFLQEAISATDQAQHKFSKTEHAWGIGGTPFLYALFSCFTKGEFGSTYHSFRLISLVLFLAGFWWSMIFLGFPAWSRLLLIVAFTEFFRPFKSDYFFANVGQIQTGLFLLSLMSLASPSKKFQWAGSIGLGLLAVLKPNLAFVPILLLVYWGLRLSLMISQRKSMGVLLGVLFGFLFPIFVLGDVANWNNWFRTFPDVLFYDLYLKNGFFGKLISPQSISVYIVSGSVGLLLVIFGMIYSKKITGPDNVLSWKTEWALSSLGVGLTFLFFPIIHPHYFLLMIPPALFALRPGRQKWLFGLSMMGCLLLMSNPFVLHNNWHQNFNHSLWNYWGLILIQGTIWYEIVKKKLQL